jgi:hypothetical protein
MKFIFRLSFPTPVIIVFGRHGAGMEHTLVLGPDGSWAASGQLLGSFQAGCDFPFPDDCSISQGELSGCRQTTGMTRQPAHPAHPAHPHTPHTPPAAAAIHTPPPSIQPICTGVHWSTLEYTGVHWSTLEYMPSYRGGCPATGRGPPYSTHGRRRSGGAV